MSGNKKNYVTRRPDGDNEPYDECALSLERCRCLASLLQSNIDQSSEEYVVAGSIVREIIEADGWFQLVQEELFVLQRQGGAVALIYNID